MNQELIREKIKGVEKQIQALKTEKLEIKKQLFQEIHNFKMGDLVIYTKPNGESIKGIIDIINDSNRTKGGKVVIYRTEVLEDYQSKEYEIISLDDWSREPDPRLTNLSRNNKENKNLKFIEIKGQRIEEGARILVKETAGYSECYVWEDYIVSYDQTLLAWVCWPTDKKRKSFYAHDLNFKFFVVDNGQRIFKDVAYF